MWVNFSGFCFRFSFMIFVVSLTFRRCRSQEQFHEPRLVNIAHGRFAIWLDPFGMLDPQVVVNLSSKFGVGINLVRRGSWLGERFECGAGRVSYLTSSASVFCCETNEFHKRLSI
jgi:hypothetical protein